MLKMAFYSPEYSIPFSCPFPQPERFSILSVRREKAGDGKRAGLFPPRPVTWLTLSMPIYPGA